MDQTGSLPIVEEYGHSGAEMIYARKPTINNYKLLCLNLEIKKKNAQKPEH